VPAQRIGEIIAGKRAVTADTDLRLCRFFGLSSGYWLRAQTAHDRRSQRPLRLRSWRRSGRDMGLRPDIGRRPDDGIRTDNAARWR